MSTDRIQRKNTNISMILWKAKKLIKIILFSTQFASWNLKLCNLEVGREKLKVSKILVHLTCCCCCHFLGRDTKWPADSLWYNLFASILVMFAKQVSVGVCVWSHAVKHFSHLSVSFSDPTTSGKFRLVWMIWSTWWIS